VVALDTTHEVCPFDFLICEHASGASLRDLDDDEPRLRDGLARFARLLRSVHELPMRGFGLLGLAPRSTAEAWPRCGVARGGAAKMRKRLDEHLSLCVDLGAVQRHEAAEAHAWFDRLDTVLQGGRPVLLHGDPGMHNVFVNGSGITALVDWEDALAGDGLYDLAFLATFHPERRWDVLLASYDTEMLRRPEARALFWLYFLRVAVAKTVHRHRYGYTDVAGRLPGHLRIRRALAELASL
jgi:aminoglycoside phosphotransferase (APT) family kinase protein